MAPRRHPVQAIAFADSTPPKLYLAVADTLSCISISAGTATATWTAPAAPAQGKPQQKVVSGKADDIDTADAAEPTPDAANSPSAPAPVVGKRKRSPSNTSAQSSTAVEATESSPAATAPQASKKKQKKGGNADGADASKKQPPNYIGHLLFVAEKSVLAVTTLEDKTLRLLHADTLAVVKEWTLHKRPSAISITDSNSTILVGDKFGDVYSYTIDSDSSSEGTLLLGHVSLLTALTAASTTTPQRQYIITADRDEHVRVTNYPLTHAIHTFCLAHTAFVSRLLVTADNTLISGGGDDWLGVWDWPAGKLLQRIDVRGVLDTIFTDDEKKAIAETQRGYNRRRRWMREDDAVREADEEAKISIAVNGIAEAMVPDGRQVIVTLEGLPVLLRYTYTATGELQFASGIRATGPVVSLAVDASRVYFSCDTTDGELVSQVDLAAVEPVISSLVSGEGLDVLVAEEDVEGMVERVYTVEGLRKGFGGWEDE
ncbi:tRNA (guanine-N(7)-)-methyltransferase non-catalytic subunit trm82 [Orbilia brochopaga]|uniref:tRNA (Guanine-N(7)-)-methyltransferase non-catalytic subunit trm82 n=1 Tax=Orbilia brochopaga TaxID=3140254 RepID=A0AAV9VEZ1_9PEZI